MTRASTKLMLEAGPDAPGNALEKGFVDQVRV